MSSDILIFVIHLLFSTILINCSIFVNTTSKRISASYPGQFQIGVLVSVHQQPKHKKNRFLECGDIREHYGIQRIEATFKTIDEINNDPNLLKNITLGVDIRDSCWYAPIALQQTIELIRESISPLPNKNSINQQNLKCYPVNDTKQDDSSLIGIIGPASSSIAMQVQNLLQLFSIPQIGYSTTSKDLSDKSRFSSFMRVVPSDYYQAQVMVEIVKRFNFTYVSAVNTNENYGQSGIQAFRELAEENNICIAKEDSILSSADEEQFEEVLHNLNEDLNANVVICFCEGLTVRGLLSAMSRLNMTERFLIIGSDGWADRQDVVTDYEREALGAITIRIHSPYVKSFDNYYFSLSPFENKRNPWFKEFWQKKFHCKMPISNLLMNETLSNDTKICTGKEKLSEKYKQEPKLSFLIKAIHTMAHGLHEMQQDLCGANVSGVCPQMIPFNRTKFFSYLMNVSFLYENDSVEFDTRGDLMKSSARYDIMNFQYLGNDTYDYVQVGDWNNGTLNFFREIQNPGPGVIQSVCTKPCSPGYYKIIQVTGGQEKKCCWMCVACEKNQYLFNETYCEDCPLGYWPNDDQTECLKIPIEELNWNEFIIATSFSIVGIMLTINVLMIFLKYNNTPVVKASTRELSYLILMGMILSHASVFAILHPPTVISCTITRMIPGVSFAMIYGSLLVKTNRIARLLAISKKRFPSTKLKFMSSISQVFLSFFLILIEMAISVYALYTERPGVEPYFPNEKRSILICNTTLFGEIAPKAFIFCLILLCTVYALKTRNVPENFNETKFVGFAMYTTIVIWIAFFPIYYGSELKLLTKSLCISLSSIMTLAFLFFPKIYIVVCHPEKNIRALFTTSKSIRCHIGGSHFHSNLSNKTSSSISSARAASSEFSKEYNYSSRSLKPIFIQASCQTSLEKLNNVEKCERSSSPIKDINLDHINESSKLIDSHLKVHVTTKATRVDKRSPIRTKLKRNKVYYEKKEFSVNETSLTKYQRVKRLDNKSKQSINLCTDCLELEKNRRNSSYYIPEKTHSYNSNFQRKKLLDSSVDSTRITRRNSLIARSNNIPIFTIDQQMTNRQLTNNKRRINIFEESLSECSISESLDCKLKRITISLK